MSKYDVTDLKSTKKFAEDGKRKEHGIPLLVYGRNGKKEVGRWWKGWKVGMSVANGDFPASL